jgi:hypothetical protein
VLIQKQKIADDFSWWQTIITNPYLFLELKKMVLKEKKVGN